MFLLFCLIYVFYILIYIFWAAVFYDYFSSFSFNFLFENQSAHKKNISHDLYKYNSTTIN